MLKSKISCKNIKLYWVKSQLILQLKYKYFGWNRVRFKNLPSRYDFGGNTEDFS